MLNQRNGARGVQVWDEMKCLASDQGGDPWVSKTVEKLAVFDFSINEHNVETEMSLFQVQ